MPTDTQVVDSIDIGGIKKGFHAVVLRVGCGSPARAVWDSHGLY